MQNPWIFNEYVRWTSPPLSFVSPTQDVGKQIFTTLANLPRILFSRPRTESTIQFGMSYEASVRPSLSLCIQDLMDGSSQGLAMPINSIFGIQAPHVQARDALGPNALMEEYGTSLDSNCHKILILFRFIGTETWHNLIRPTLA